MIEEDGDTIAATATAPGEAGIAIVRVSGPSSLDIADRVVRCRGARLSERPGGSFVYGAVRVGGAGATTDVDEVVALVYRAPHSYTREDVVELQGHGGRVAAGRILRAVLAEGARPAEPGEFTRRAFLNGRIDLLQAEAVADLIRARSDRAATVAMEQLEGGLSATFERIYGSVIDVAGNLEAMLDFEEGELPASAGERVRAALAEAGRGCRELLLSWQEGHVLREGALAVISGRPNAGKSTLLNALLGSNRAIVADLPGTTRDTIEEQVVIEGIPLRLVDTAGLRLADSEVEQAGIDRAWGYVRRADINLHVLDASRELDDEEREILQGMDPGTCVVVLNKTDLPCRVEPGALPHGLVGLPASLTQGEGVPGIRRALIQALDLTPATVPHAVISERHRQLIQNALNAIDKTAALLESEEEDMLVFAAETIKAAANHIGMATGKVYTDELLDNIFSRFCVGK